MCTCVYTYTYENCYIPEERCIHCLMFEKQTIGSYTFFFLTISLIIIINITIINILVMIGGH